MVVWAYRGLDVWQRSRRFVHSVYSVSDAFPRSERYGLTAQVRRAVVSIGANIAEGAGRNTDGEFALFLGYAHGSLNEVEHHLTIARDLGYLSEPQSAALSKDVNDLGKMIRGLRRRASDQSLKPKT